MQTTKFYDLKPGDRFVDQDDRVCTKLTSTTARLHIAHPPKEFGRCIATVGAGTLVRFLPAVPAKFKENP
jgi:hypothetical protein